MSSSRISRPVATYLRISKASEDSSSLAKQRANVARLIAARWPGVPVVEFAEERSATKAARPKFDALRARLGDFQAVVIDTQDRIARRPLDFWAFAADAERLGVPVVAASEDLDLSTADGELTAGIRLSVARAEARRTSARVKATNAHRRREGIRPLGGNPAFGQRRSGADGHGPIVVDPATAPLVREAAAQVIAGGSASSICRDWNARGIRPPRAAEWSRQVIAGLLAKPALAGMIPDGADVLRGPDGLPIVDDGAAVLDVETWEALQVALSRRKVSRRPTEPTEARTEAHLPPLLAGLVECENGHRLYSHDHGERRNYACRVTACSAMTAVRMAALDVHVASEVLSRFGAYEEVRPVTVSAPRDAARLAAVRAEIARTLAAMADPGADVASLATRLVAQRAAETDLLAQDAEEKIELRPTGRTIREAYEAADDDDTRREIIAGTVVAVVVGKGVRGGDRRNGKPSPALGGRVRIVWRGTPEAALRTS